MTYRAQPQYSPRRRPAFISRFAQRRPAFILHGDTVRLPRVSVKRLEVASLGDRSILTAEGIEYQQQAADTVSAAVQSLTDAFVDTARAIVENPALREFEQATRQALQDFSAAHPYRPDGTEDPSPTDEPRG